MAIHAEPAAAPGGTQAGAEAATARPLSVLIADDHALVRDGMKLLLARLLGPVCFVEAGDAATLVQMARLQPQLRLAVVDLNMPGMERGYRLAELARECPALPLVVVSALTAPDVVRRTLAIPSVHAFVPKSAGAEQMRAALLSALAGRKMPFTLAPGAELGARPSLEPGLTPRMEEIRALLRQGMSNKLIARTLGISEGTVKNYMSDMFKALNVSNRTQAAQVDTSRL